MSSNYYKEKCWWASPYNDYPNVIDQAALPKKVEIHDATLRDGEQTAGVVFSVDDKIRIAEKLNELGIERIEAGMPAVSTDDYTAVKSICKRNLNSKIFAFTRAMRVDIDQSVDCGVHGVIIEVPIGYPKLKYQFNWTWENVLEKSLDCINYAKSQGLYTVIFPYDTTRAREEDLENLMTGLMKDSSPDSVGVVDTMGCATPESIQYLVRKMNQWTGGIPVEVHTHNDFGMGVATEFAGMLAGSTVLHSCMNGLGERTGNAATEELMVGMKILYGLDNDYKLDKLVDACAMVSDISGIPIATNKPISGSRNYTRESGIGVNLVVSEPLAMFATDPQLFGREGQVVLGKKSGKASIEHYFNQMGVPSSDALVETVLAKVKALSISKKRLVTMEEFQNIINSSK